MNRAVNITKRIWVEGKGYRFCPAVWADKKRIKPHVVMVNGKREERKDGRYYISFYVGKTLKREPCESAMHAVERMVALQAKMAAVNQGFEIVSEPASDKPAGHNLIETATAWIKVKKVQNPKGETVRSYEGAVNLFLEFMQSRPHQTIEEIDRNDMHDFITFMRNRVHKQRGKKGKRIYAKKKGMSASTQLNRFVIVKTFLRNNGWVDCTERGDTPKFTSPTGRRNRVSG